MSSSADSTARATRPHHAFGHSTREQPEGTTAATNYKQTERLETTTPNTTSSQDCRYGEWLGCREWECGWQQLCKRLFYTSFEYLRMSLLQGLGKRYCIKSSYTLKLIKKMHSNFSSPTPSRLCNPNLLVSFRGGCRRIKNMHFGWHTFLCRFSFDFVVFLDMFINASKFSDGSPIFRSRVGKFPKDSKLSKDSKVSKVSSTHR